MIRDALVVGINQYDRLKNLKSPAEDANAIAELLKHYSDFNIKPFPIVMDDTLNSFKVGLETHVTCNQLKRELSQLFKPEGISIPDTALFFFAGHGLREKEGIVEGYLATSDSDPESGKWGVSLYWLRRLLHESPVRQQIIWLDCCYSGELLNFNEADPGDRGKGRDRCFIAASREYQQAYEISGKHGFLTQALLDGLDPFKQPNGLVDNSALVTSIRQNWQIGFQRPIINNSGEQIILTRCDDREKEEFQITDSVCPYKGLNYFDCNDEDPKYFFGRTALTDQLIEKVREGNFLAVLGASGSGKSSVVRAGLLHHLKMGQRLAGSEKWPIFILHPGEHPLKNLAFAFLDPACSTVERAEKMDKAEALISKCAAGLERLISASAGKGRVILVVDQFEEIFTLCEDNEKRLQFFKTLLKALPLTNNKLCLIITMRADFFAKCSEQEYAGLAGYIQENLVTITPMSSEELKQAIIEPAKKVGSDVEKELVTQMINDVQDSPGSLPLLQYTLTELWQHRNQNRLTLNKYIQIGQVKGTLAKRADEVFIDLSPEEQPVAKRIFLELTQLGEGTEDTRRQVKINSLATSKQPKALVNQVIQKLADAKLVVTSKEMGKGREEDRLAIVDVAHEALIRHWPLLRKWLDENRDDLRFQRRLDVAAQYWYTNKRPGGLLWRSPDLDLLKDFHRRFSSDMTEVQTEFFHASIHRERFIKRMIWLTCSLLIILAIVSGFAAIYALKSRSIAVKETNKSKSLLAKNYWLNATTAMKNNDWLKASHFLARSGKEESDLLQIKNCILNIYVYSNNLFLNSPLLIHVNSFYDAIFSKDGNIILTWGGDHTARLWHTKDGTPAAQPMIHDDFVIAAMFSQNGNLILSWSRDHTARLWHTKDGTPASQPMKHDHSVNGAMFSKDGNLILTWSDDGTARLWHTKDGTSAAQPMIHNGSVGIAMFSKDGNLILTWSRNDTAWLWHIKDGTPAAQPLIHDDSVYGAMFSKDETLILTWSRDHTARLWHIKDGTPAAQPLIHDDSVYGAMFSKDGNLILTWGYDNTARLWHTKDGTPIAPPMKHDRFIDSAMFSKDTDLILTRSGNTARLWDISADYDFPKENLPLLVEVITGTVMDDYGNVTVLGPEEWLKRKQEYIKICEDHLKACKYKKANLYLKQNQARKGE